MPVQLAEAIVLIVGVYAALGLLVAPILVFRLAERFDAATAESSRGFRLIVLPGAVLLWPLLLRRALSAAGQPPIESNAHRARAASEPTLAGTQAGDAP